MGGLISERQWTKIYEIINGAEGIYSRQEKETRLFIEAVTWICRSGAQWRLLPKEYGDWNTVFKRFRRWSKKGIWQKLMRVLAEDADIEWGMIDSTIVRAHSCSTGAKGGLQ